MYNNYGSTSLKQYNYNKMALLFTYSQNLTVVDKI